MNHWLMKSEPSELSFDDLKKRPKRTEAWSGVRNYQARNFMRAMAVGDLALFYHSSCDIPGAAGVARIRRTAYPDPSAWDSASPYHDARSTPAKPLWDMVDVTWHADFSRFVTLDALRAEPALKSMLILRRGNRLSITPVTEKEFQQVCKLGGTAL